MGEVLPPHLSPFVDASSRRIGDYIPPEEKKLLGMEDESAAQKKKASEDEEEDSEEEDESNEEEEEEEEESEASGDDVEETEGVRIINFYNAIFKGDLCVPILSTSCVQLQSNSSTKHPRWLFRKRRARCRWRRAKQRRRRRTPRRWRPRSSGCVR